ncbi:peptidyl-prolyl cis-trans isomerase [Rasiella sp. SM2506]|uniref:peptidyl-prolyl cis-trans isomerase n=1 Tax=Rasiella sp. SM2506 TaxID=3423914 RepID=UPI003D7B0209
MKITGYLLCVCILVSSCDYFKEKDDRVPIARVNNSYLYQEDIAALISENASQEDSTLIVSNYINRWATQQILMDQAIINIPENKQENYNKLIAEYKRDLYTEAYKNTIISKQLDSTVSQYELENFYEENKQNFKLNDQLFKVRYIQIDKDFTNFTQTSQKIERFNAKDKKDLMAESIQYKSFNLNDSTWVKRESLEMALPILQITDEQKLKKSNFIRLQDSLGVYLLKIEDRLNPSDIAPLLYVKPTIEQILLNKRKLDLIKKLEKDITTDAIKNNNFEIYENE